MKENKEIVEEKELKQEIKTTKNKGNIIIVTLAVVCNLIILVTVTTLGIKKLSAPKVKEKQEIENPKTSENEVEIIKPSKEYNSPYKITKNGLTEFDLYFLKLENGTNNKIYSPLSIKYLLEMLSEGANGDSKGQIDSLISEYPVVKYSNSANFSFANAMFVRSTIIKSVRESYKKRLSEKYNADVIEDSFEDNKKLNKWIEEKTLGLMKDGINEPINEYQFFLLNSLGIDMNWKNQLICEPTEADVPCKLYAVLYNHENYYDTLGGYVYDHKYSNVNFENVGNVEAPTIAVSANNYDIVKTLGEDSIRKTVGAEFQKYLDSGKTDCGTDINKYLDSYIASINENYKKVSESTDFSFYMDDDIQVFAKDLQEYNGIELQYVGIMPTSTALNKYIETIDSNKINNIISSLKEIKSESFEEGVVTQFRGQIPLFKFDYELKLMDDLKTLGVEDVFDQNKADLSRIFTEETKGMYIKKILHKTNIEFSNDGIKASSISVGGGWGSSSCGFDYKYDIPVKKVNMIFDKPYLFLIRDKKTGEIWFTGTVYEPNKAQ